MEWLGLAPLSASVSGSASPAPAPRSTREMEDTLGAVSLSQSPSLTSRSLISQLKMPGLSRLYSSILLSTSGVATRGLLPPITPGRMLPVSWYLAVIMCYINTLFEQQIVHFR